MNTKKILQWVSALWQHVAESREGTMRHLEILSQLVVVQGNTIARLLALCEERFSGDEQSIGEIRESIDAHAGVTNEFKRMLQRDQPPRDQLAAMLADVQRAIDGMPDE